MGGHLRPRRRAADATASRRSGAARPRTWPRRCRGRSRTEGWPVPRRSPPTSCRNRPAGRTSASCSRPAPSWAGWSGRSTTGIPYRAESASLVVMHPGGPRPALPACAPSTTPPTRWRWWRRCARRVFGCGDDDLVHARREHRRPLPSHEAPLPRARTPACGGAGRRWPSCTDLRMSCRCRRWSSTSSTRVLLVAHGLRAAPTRGRPGGACASSSSRLAPSPRPAAPRSALLRRVDGQASERRSSTTTPACRCRGPTTTRCDPHHPRRQGPRVPGRDHDRLGFEPPIDGHPGHPRPHPGPARGRGRRQLAHTRLPAGGGTREARRPRRGGAPHVRRRDSCARPPHPQPLAEGAWSDDPTTPRPAPSRRASTRAAWGCGSTSRRRSRPQPLRRLCRWLSRPPSSTARPKRPGWWDGTSWSETLGGLRLTTATGLAREADPDLETDDVAASRRGRGGTARPGGARRPPAGPARQPRRPWRSWRAPRPPPRESPRAQ